MIKFRLSLFDKLFKLSINVNWRAAWGVAINYWDIKMDVSTLLFFLNTVDPAIADEIYQLAEDWPNKSLEPQQSHLQSAQTSDQLSIEQ